MATWFKLNGDERLGICASENCGGQPTFRFEAEGIGSNYCSGCKERWEHFAEANHLPGGRSDGKLVQS